MDLDIKQGVHKQLVCLKLLYFLKDELGQELHNINYKCEQMLLHLYNIFKQNASASTKQSAIIKTEHNKKPQLKTIQKYLKTKYKLQS